MQINNLNIKGIQDVADSAVRMDQERIPETKVKENFSTTLLKDIKTGSENYNKDSLLDDVERKSALGVNADEQAKTMKTEMVMALNSMSDADLDEIEKNGISPKDLKPEDYVTIADKIRINLAKAGADVEAFGGIDADTVAAVTGSETFAAVFKSAMEARDLPTDDAILKDADTAFKKIDSMKGMLETGLSDDTMTFLLKNELSPSIDNIFRATFAGRGGEMETEDIDEEMMPSIYNHVTSEGLPLTEEYVGNAVWLAERELPITERNITYLTDLNSVELTDPQDFLPEMMQSMLDSVSEGKMPQDAFMIRGYSLHDKAEEIYAVVNEATDRNIENVIRANRPVTVESIRDDILYNIPESLSIDAPAAETTATKTASAETAVPAESPLLSNEEYESTVYRRQLEEIRLSMTVEANYSLMKKGINIDTSELSDLIEHLKAEEQAFTIALLSETGDTESYLQEKASLYNEVAAELNTLKDMPAAILGRIPDIHQGTIHSITKMTVSYSETVMNAEKLYEAMHTEVRRDLGDTIGKAFRNVDDILSELQMEASSDNERAVRILAYNEMALTPENISMIKEADALMQRTFKNMTPRTVSDMIKAGENPLDLKLSDLNDMAESFSRENGSHSDEEKFAEFLWKAEHAEGVSDEERQGLIGIFRLIHQVNKNDGAAIGMLIKQGTEATLRNLMTASRNRKAEGMDFAIDDSFGLMEEFNRSELTITEQIEMSFQSMCMKNTEEEITPFKMMDMGGEEPIMQMTPEELWNRLRETEEPAEIEQAFLQSKREEMKEAVKAEDRIYSMLKEYDIPASPVNLNAAAEFMKDRNASYETLKRFNEKLREGSEIKGALEALLNDDDMLLTPEEMQEQAEKREQDTKQALSDFMENEEVNEIDLKALRLVNAKMSVFTKMAREETYNVPITVADQLTNMTVKIVRGAEHKGLVDIALESDITGNMRASMRYENGTIFGSVFMSNRGTADLFENHRADFENNIKEATGFDTEIKTGFDRNVDAASLFTERSYGFTETNERDKADTATLYSAAKAFLDSVKELV